MGAEGGGGRRQDWLRVSDFFGGMNTWAGFACCDCRNDTTKDPMKKRRVFTVIDGEQMPPAPEQRTFSNIVGKRNTVANRNFSINIANATKAVTTVPALPSEVDGSANVRCGLGLTFREDAATGLLIVHSITPGGGAANCGTIQKGDILCELDGIDVTHTRPEAMSHLCVGLPGSQVVVGVKRPPDNNIILRHTVFRCRPPIAS